MKFLAHGDSVVSLRFRYLEGGPDNYEAEKLTFDTVGEIQDAMAQLFPDGDMPFSLQEDVLDLDAFKDNGDYTQSDLIARLSGFQNNLNAALSQRGQYPDISSFMDAVQEFMGSRAIDLSEFRDETSDLMTGVKQAVEHAEAGGDTRLELADLAGDITPDALQRDAERTNNGEQTQDVPVASFAAKASELPTVIASAEDTINDVMAEMAANTTIGGNPDAVYAQA